MYSHFCQTIWRKIKIPCSRGSRKSFPEAQRTHSIEIFITGVTLLVSTRWRHLHKFKIWSLGGATCLVILLGIAQLASLAKIGIVSSSARVSSAKSWKCLLQTVADRQTGIRSPDLHLGPIEIRMAISLWLAGQIGSGAMRGSLWGKRVAIKDER